MLQSVIVWSWSTKSSPTTNMETVWSQEQYVDFTFIFHSSYVRFLLWAGDFLIFFFFVMRLKCPSPSRLRLHNTTAARMNVDFHQKDKLSLPHVTCMFLNKRRRPLHTQTCCVKQPPLLVFYIIWWIERNKHELQETRGWKNKASLFTHVDFNSLCVFLSSNGKKCFTC